MSSNVANLEEKFNELAFRGEAMFLKAFRGFSRVGYTFLQPPRITTQLLVIKTIWFQLVIYLWRHGGCQYHQYVRNCSTVCHGAGNLALC